MDRWQRRVELAFWCALTLAALLGLVALFVPHQITYAEGYMLDQAVRVADGEGLYRERQPPWVLDNFPPVWPAALALGVRLFGVSFAWGRALTVAAVAGLLVLLLAFQRRRGDPRWLAWGAAALWLLSPYVLRRVVVTRMDYPALLLAAVGVWCALSAAGAGEASGRASASRRRRIAAAVAAVLAFALAAYTRQTMLVAPVAAAVGLWLAGRRRLALGLLAGTAGVVAAAAVVLQEATDGTFLRQTVLDNTGRYLLEKLLAMTWRLAVVHFPLLLLGAWGAWRGLRDGAVQGRVLAVWAAFEAAASLTAGKPGAAINHYLPLLYVAALHAAPGMQAAAEAVQRRRAARAARTVRPGVPPAPATTPAPTAALVPAAATRAHATARLVFTVLVLQAVLLAGPLAVVSGYVLSLQDDQTRLVSLVRAEEAPVLSENAGVVLQAGHPVLFEPRLLRERHAAGAWEDGPLVRALEDRNFSLVVTEVFPDHQTAEEGFRFTPAAWRALQENYAPDETLGRWRVWRPLP